MNSIFTNSPYTRLFSSDHSQVDRDSEARRQERICNPYRFLQQKNCSLLRVLFCKNSEKDQDSRLVIRDSSCHSFRFSGTMKKYVLLCVAGGWIGSVVGAIVGILIADRPGVLPGTLIGIPLVAAIFIIANCLHESVQCCPEEISELGFRRKLMRREEKYLVAERGSSILVDSSASDDDTNSNDSASCRLIGGNDAVMDSPPRAEEVGMVFTHLT